MTNTLTKIEKEIVTDVLVRGHYDAIDVPSFNHAVAYSLPTWRAEYLLGPENDISIAYVDYYAEILNMFDKA